MKQVTQAEFDRMVEDAARAEYNKNLRLGRFIPIQFLRSEVRRKLSYTHKVVRTKGTP